MRLIDVDALIRELNEEIIMYPKESPEMDPIVRYVHRLVPKLINNVIDHLKCQPTVDAVPVVHGYDTGKARLFQCSVCGWGYNDIYLVDESGDMLSDPKYCAHCGAKMDGGGG